MDQAIPYMDFWRRFLAVTNDPSAQDRYYDVMRLGDGEAGADEGAELVLAGEKTATSHLLDELQSEGRDIPKEGSLSILLDGKGQPVAVVETTEVVVEKFSEIDDAFARAFGEWGGSLKSWRRQSRAHYAPRARALGKPFGEDTLLVCERFHVVFSPQGVAAAPKRGR